MNMQINLNHKDTNFNLSLGRSLFSDPQRDKQNAVVVSNCHDIIAGIEVNDLVKVDFTVNEIDRDGLYVITLDDGWIGYRRFQFMPKLRVIDSHDSYAVTPEVLAKVKVVGLVKDIYRSVK